uniref:Uncharacterized protein n=1 Tax=viral metagenome TaxID=1070528 RepID=A0A6C0F5R7_9ZZZZ
MALNNKSPPGTPVRAIGYRNPSNLKKNMYALSASFASYILRYYQNGVMTPKELYDMYRYSFDMREIENKIRTIEYDEPPRLHKNNPMSFNTFKTMFIQDAILRPRPHSANASRGQVRRPPLRLNQSSITAPSAQPPRPHSANASRGQVRRPPLRLNQSSITAPSAQPPRPPRAPRAPRRAHSARVLGGKIAKTAAEVLMNKVNARRAAAPKAYKTLLKEGSYRRTQRLKKGGTWPRKPNELSRKYRTQLS